MELISRLVWLMTCPVVGEYQLYQLSSHLLKCCVYEIYLRQWIT